MRIAVLGTGNVGRAVGAGLAAAGHDVVYGAREPASRGDLPGVVASPAEAVDGAEVIVNGMPGEVTEAALRDLPAGSLDGKILIDPTTALTADHQLLHPNSSLAETLQTAFPTLRVVKTLATVAAPVMADPAALSAPTTMFLSGDDADAKRVAAGLLVDLGWATDTHFDLGDVTTARATEHYFFLFMALFQATGNDVFGITLVRAPEA